jgi:hypothetical protein
MEAEQGIILRAKFVRKVSGGKDERFPGKPRVI